jgi:hypothetical protein
MDSDRFPRRKARAAAPLELNRPMAVDRRHVHREHASSSEELPYNGGDGRSHAQEHEVGEDLYGTGERPTAPLISTVAVTLRTESQLNYARGHSASRGGSGASLAAQRTSSTAVGRRATPPKNKLCSKSRKSRRR